MPPVSEEEVEAFLRSWHKNGVIFGCEGDVLKVIHDALEAAAEAREHAARREYALRNLGET